jgi:hypothetical protein
MIGWQCKINISILINNLKTLLCEPRRHIFYLFIYNKVILYILHPYIICIYLKRFYHLIYARSLNSTHINKPSHQKHIGFKLKFKIGWIFSLPSQQINIINNLPSNNLYAFDFTFQKYFWKEKCILYIFWCFLIILMYWYQ